MVDAVNPVLDALSGPSLPQHGFPFDWGWEFQDGKRAFLSGPIAIVDKTDPIFVEWADDGRVPSSMPTDTEGNDSIVELQLVLDAYDLHATLQHYAGGIRYGIEIAGVPVQIGGETVTMATDRASRDGARDTMIAIMAGLRQDGASFKFADEISRPATNDEMKVAIATAFAHVQGAYDREALVEQKIAEGLITSKADVEAVFAAPVVSAIAKKAAAKSTAKSTS